MTKLGAALGVAFVALGAFASCGSDDDAKRVHADDAGAAGMEAGGGEAPQQGGSSSEPSAGQGGMPGVAEGGAGGEPMVPVGGQGGAAQGGAGGAPEQGGAGGALDCPLQPGAFTYSCGEVRDLWLPTFVTSEKTFHFDASSLPFPVASGRIEFFYNVNAAQFCGSADVVVTGTDVAVLIDTAAVMTSVRITDFTLTDTCGGTHSFDPAGAPECNDLTGTGQPGTWDLGCTVRLGPCPDQCF